jgi:hypothetical protein
MTKASLESCLSYGKAIQLTEKCFIQRSKVLISEAKHFSGISVFTVFSKYGLFLTQMIC